MSLDAINFYNTFTNTINDNERFEKYSEMIEKACKLAYSQMPMFPTVTSMGTQANATSTIQLNSGDTLSINDDNQECSYDAKELKSKWSKSKPHLTDEFYNKVVDIAKRLNCNPNHLMALMNAESGIKANAKNKSSSATGLIQFIGSVAKELGTTTAELKQMSEVEQLKYVEKYLAKHKKRIGLGANDKLTAGDLYAIVYLPGRAKNENLAYSHEKYYTAGANEKLDLNGDGVITKTELGDRLLNKFMA